MKITIICVGKIKEKFYTEAVREYSKRLSRYCTLSITEVADEKTKEQASETEIAMVKDREGERIIGGSLGLSDKVLKRADARLSFSKMTFPHQLMRVILLEQIYRSYRIMHHEPYHK